MFVNGKMLQHQSEAGAAGGGWVLVPPVMALHSEQRRGDPQRGGDLWLCAWHWVRVGPRDPSPTSIPFGSQPQEQLTRSTSVHSRHRRDCWLPAVAVPGAQAE